MRQYRRKSESVKKNIIFVVVLCILAAVGGSMLVNFYRPAVSAADYLSALTTVDSFVATPRGMQHMESSYDRAGGNIDWAEDLTHDRDGLVTLLDIKGPGVLSRIWMTSVRADRWFIFVDGKAQPKEGLTTDELFGGSYPFVPPLSQRNSGGFISYVPIPFQRSLRIAIEQPEINPEWRQYFHFNWEQLPFYTKVSPFAWPVDEAFTNAADAVIEEWERLAMIPEWQQKLNNGNIAYLEPGKETELFHQDHGGIIRKISISPPDKAQVEYFFDHILLRGLVLRAYWDDNKKPSVDVPLGDFFCNGISIRRFNSMPIESRGGVFHSRFPMPFRENARITIRNDTRQPIKIQYLINVEENNNLTNNYFHARWTQNTTRGQPLWLLDTHGQGHFVGTYVVSHSFDGSWNVLEGDEVFHIDNGKSLWHGTGLEDYFNGGWYYYGLFDWPLYGLINKAAMQTDQYRFHINDAISFTERLVGTFQFGDANQTDGYMSAAVYWYQDKPVAANSGIPTLEQRLVQRNPVARQAFMAELFELERLNLYKEAARRCFEYARMYPHDWDTEIIYLRGHMYRNKNINASREDRIQIIKEEKKELQSDEAKRQAEILDWYYRSLTNVIAGFHVNGDFAFYINGQLISNSAHPLTLDIRQLTLSPETYHLTAKVTATRQRPWLRACIRTANGDIHTDATWQVTHNRPSDWPIANDPEIDWQPTRTIVVPPWMGYWTFSPNAFIDMQAGSHFIRPKGDWNIGRTVYFRKTVDISELTQDKKSAQETKVLIDLDEQQQRATSGEIQH